MATVRLSEESAPQFTPGPWVVHPLMAWVSPAADIDIPICQLRRATNGIPADEAAVKADAHLIAAAPELYEAVRGMLQWRLPHDRAFTVTDGSRRAFDNLIAALSSARGEQGK